MHVIRLLPLFILFTSFSVLKAQKPTASPSSGCVPLTVTFTAPPGATNVIWDFGDGFGAGNLTSVVHTYDTVGTMVVTFTNNSIPDTIHVNVFSKPEAGFMATTSTSGCIPLPVGFQDTSIGGGGAPIVAWQWAFGDGGGNTSTGTPNHIFTDTGSFDVSLIVTDANGCKNTITIDSMVNTSMPPNAIITSNPPNPPSACFAPFEVAFSGANSTPGNGGASLTFLWSFGNGDSSTSVNDTSVYDTTGVFPVTLIVTDNNNCSKTTSTNVIINNPSASFSVTNDTVCKSVNFTNLSTIGIYQWNFGDGTITPADSGVVIIGGVNNTSGTYNFPTHEFANPLPYNPYSITLTVTNTSNGLTCTADTTITFFVDGVHASFTSTPHYSCGVPFPIQFTDNSTNASQWSWLFGNDSTSIIMNPLLIIDPTDTNEYTIHWMELFDDYLLVTSPHGCTDDTTVLDLDTLYKPTAVFMPDSISGCFPLTVTFFDSSKSNETIVNWHWFFGDGTDTSGGNIIDTIAHTFTSPGDYKAYLVIMNSAGCIDTSYSILIEVGKPPSPDFSASPLQVCPYDTVQFTNLTPLSDSVDTWHYVTDGILMWACKEDPNPTWEYSSDVGFFDVTLTVGYNGCFSDTTITNMVEVLGPIGRFRYEADCDSPFVYSFFSESKGYTKLDWYFGDGDSLLQTTDANPVHTYETTGDFTVILIAYNDTTGCDPSSDTIIVRVRNVKAVIGDTLSGLQDSLFCSGIPAELNASYSVDVYNYCHRGFRWDFGDNTPPLGTDNPIINHSFNYQGYLNIRLVVRDTNGCTDTAFKSLLIHKITADFVMDTTVGYFGINDTLLTCIPAAIQFTDSTVADTGLYSWLWGSFSWDLTTGNPVGFPDISTSQNPSFTYNSFSTGLYQVFLLAEDSLGCKDSIGKFIRVSYPDSNFATIPDSNIYRELCVGDSVQFDASNGNQGSLYSWDFGEGGTGSIKSPYNVYDTAGDFAVTLVLTDSVGCTVSKTIDNYIHVQDYPIAGFFITAIDDNGATVTVDSNTVLCYPQQPVFHDTSHYSAIIEDYIWNLGTGSSVLNDSVVTRNCNTPDVYPISLIVSTTFGCQDTATGFINLVGPIADFSISDSLICRNDSILFALKDTTDVFVFGWEFGDGQADSSGVDSISHVYNYHPPSGQTSAMLIFWGPDSTCKKTSTHTIYVYQVIADFGISDLDGNGIDSTHCLGFPDKFSDSSSTITDSWNWDYGDGFTATGGGTHNHTYASADTFDIRLSISENASGCKDTIIKQVIVFPLPTALATGNDTCKGDSIQIFAAGGVTYQWSPDNGSLSDVNDSTPFAGPSSTTIYTVTVTDENGCTDTDTAEVFIYQPPISDSKSRTIVIGDTVQIIFDQGTDYTYSWDPTQWLTCTDCPNPTAQPMVTTTYEMTIEDNLGCFSVISSYEIIVEPKDSLDVPDAFTPGATVNNIVYARGRGIKTLLEFKIYNRWGQMVYENPGDINQGWDGTYNGKLQNMDTYIYYVKAETYISSEPKIRSGHLLLIR